MSKYPHKKVERKWQDVWERRRTYETDLLNAQKPFYNLMMFPYPSAEGLHVGNVYAFTGSDIFGRFKRMQGYDVFEPIGLDGFGIHSENHALNIGEHPIRVAARTQKNFYTQLKKIGNGYNWDAKLETYDPEYYKWTQWIFLQMYKHGLAYRKEADVNWCPKCLTVLADEQVISGECERCGTKVVVKKLKQWFFRITKYTDQLLEGLDNIDWSETVKVAQRNWIGRSEGTVIDFPVKDSWERITVFTTRPDTLFGATYIVLSPKHALLTDNKLQITNEKEVEDYINKSKGKIVEERTQKAKEKTGVELKGVKAVNPINSAEIPIWVADYVLGDVGTGAIMAVPAHDERDWEFAVTYGLPIKMVISATGDNAPKQKMSKENMRCYTGEGVLINSGRFDGISSQRARLEITESVGGKMEKRFHLRDWLISRQRYWGPPIPVLYCKRCYSSGGEEGVDYTEKDGEHYAIIPIPEEDLPVKLPYIEEFRPTGTDKAPLANVAGFYKSECPKCGGEAIRETDVSDTFLDSVWYYIGYLIFRNQKSEIWHPKNGWSGGSTLFRKWLPVRMYIGGAEHAVLHLLYTRFLSYAFYDLGLVHFKEPFTVFRAHGLLISEGAKISKSRGNIINPDQYIEVYGADTLRMYLMFLGPFESGGDFRDTGIRGIARFLDRVWQLYKCVSNANSAGAGDRLEKIVHKTIRKVTNDITHLRYNTAIAALMIFLNDMERENTILQDTYATFLQFLAPFAPHMCEELWEMLGHNESIHHSSWPAFDEEKLKEETFQMAIQINGKLRDVVTVPVGVSESEATKIAFSSKKANKYLEGRKYQRVIFVPGRLMNIVI